MFLIVLVKTIKNSPILKVKPAMPLSIPIFPEALIYISMLFPCIFPIAISQIICPATNINFLIFNKSLLSYAMFHIIKLLPLIYRITFFSMDFTYVLPSLYAHSMLFTVFEKSKEIGPVQPGELSQSFFLLCYSIDFSLVVFAFTNFYFWEFVNFARSLILLNKSGRP